MTVGVGTEFHQDAFSTCYRDRVSTFRSPAPVSPSRQAET